MPMETEPTPTPTAQVPPPPPAATPAPASAPTPAATPVQSSAAGSGSTGAVPASGAGSPTPGVPATPAAPQTVTPEQYAQLQRQYEAAQQQARQYEQYKHLIPLGYAAYQQQLQGQPAQGQGQPQPAAAEPPKNPFGLPAFDYALLNWVQKDAGGNLVAIPGGPPDAAIRVQQFQDQLRTVQQQFWSDPMKFLGGLIQEQAKKVAEETYKSQFGGYQQQEQAKQLFASTEPWLYERDAQGNQVTTYDPATGRNKPQLSAAGRFYAEQVQAAHRQGIADPTVQHEYAIARLKNAIYEANQRQQQAGAQGQQQAAAFVQGAQQQAAAPNPTPAQPVRR
jgi:hypothetical protein